MTTLTETPPVATGAGTDMSAIDLNAKAPCECRCHPELREDVRQAHWRHARPCGHGTNLCGPCRFRVDLSVFAGMKVSCPECRTPCPPPLDWRPL